MVNSPEEVLEHFAAANEQDKPFEPDAPHTISKAENVARQLNPVADFRCITSSSGISYLQNYGDYQKPEAYLSGSAKLAEAHNMPVVTRIGFDDYNRPPEGAGLYGIAFPDGSQFRLNNLQEIPIPNPKYKEDEFGDAVVRHFEAQFSKLAKETTTVPRSAVLANAERGDFVETSRVME